LQTQESEGRVRGRTLTVTGTGRLLVRQPKRARASVTACRAGGPGRPGPRGARDPSLPNDKLLRPTDPSRVIGQLGAGLT
jgi:hypothetical protein